MARLSDGICRLMRFRLRTPRWRSTELIFQRRQERACREDLASEDRTGNLIDLFKFADQPSILIDCERLAFQHVFRVRES